MPQTGRERTTIWFRWSDGRWTPVLYSAED